MSHSTQPLVLGSIEHIFFVNVLVLVNVTSRSYPLESPMSLKNKLQSRLPLLQFPQHLFSFVSLVLHGALAFVIALSVSTLPRRRRAGNKEGRRAPRGSKLGGNTIRGLPLETSLGRATTKKRAERARSLALMWEESIGRRVSDMRSIRLKNWNNNG